MPEGQQNSAIGHGLSLPKIAICKIAAEYGGDIHQRRISTVDDAGILIRKQPVLSQIENQQRAHSVIGKTLPHLGKE